MRRPNPIIACTAAFALVLTGCGVEIEPTDLSAVTVESDRTTVEKTLGKPDEVIEVQSFTVASYSYNRGIYEPAPSGDGGISSALELGRGDPTGSIGLVALLILAVAAPIDYANRSSKARARQERQLAAIFGADDKLLFVGSLDETAPTSIKLASISTRFNEAQSENAAALFDLSEVALIPDQKQTFLERAANSGSAEAQYRISSLVAGDADKIGWLRSAAAQDHPGAQIDLGSFLLYGPNDLVDRKEAKVWLTKAAEAGNSEAQTELTKLSSFESNLARAERGELEAQYALGNAFENGEAVKRNPAEAVNWWLKAAEAGYFPAQAKLGNDGRGIKADRQQVKLWLSRAAAAGDQDAVESLKKLTSNEDRVRKLRVMAQQGDAVSQRNLGHAYRSGRGAEYDIEKAIQWYERSAASGDVNSLYILGRLHESGHEIENDRIAAFKWYSIAEPKSLAAKSQKGYLTEVMTPIQIEEAERLADEWLEAHPQ